MFIMIFGSHIFYASENNSVAYALLKLSYDRVKSQLESYERLLNDSNSQLSTETRRSLQRVMIYGSGDLEAYYHSWQNILDLQRSQRLMRTEKFQKSGISQQAYVDKKMQEFRENLVLSERQLNLLGKNISLK